VGADEAYRIGLVDRLVDTGTAEQAARDLAEELRVLSLPAQQAVIRAVDAAYESRGFATEVALVQQLFASGEAKEGIAAFLEKRSPNFA